MVLDTPKAGLCWPVILILVVRVRNGEGGLSLKEDGLGPMVLAGTPSTPRSPHVGVVGTLHSAIDCKQDI